MHGERNTMHENVAARRPGEPRSPSSSPPPAQYRPITPLKEDGTDALPVFRNYSGRQQHESLGSGDGRYAAIASPSGDISSVLSGAI